MTQTYAAATKQAQTIPELSNVQRTMPTPATVLDATVHIQTVARAWAAQIRTGRLGYVGVDADNTVHPDLHSADVVTFDDTDPASEATAFDPMDIGKLQRHFTAALVSTNVRSRMQFANRNTAERMTVVPGTYTTEAVIDNVSTMRTNSVRFPRFMLLDIMRVLLDLLPQQYVAVRTGVLTSDVYRGKLRAELAVRKAAASSITQDHAVADATTEHTPLGQPFFELMETEQTLVLHRSRLT